MDALDVISLQQAKDYLVVEDNFYDADITRLVSTAVEWVEKYTDHMLYERDIEIPLTSCEQDIYTYPITINSVEKASVSQTYTTVQKALRIVVKCQTWNGSIVGATVGYVTNPPAPLVGAAYKLLTYLFENKDTYGATIPYDIQLLINQHRRGSSSI
jgi:hypothetical protein